jgi:hypothetical protein
LLGFWHAPAGFYNGFAMRDFQAARGTLQLYFLAAPAVNS